MSASDESKPTLQRLLALDKTFDTFEQRIDEAARLLNIALDDTETSKDDHAPDQSPDLSNYGRHEFVLRYLLDQFRTQPQAGATPSAWNLAHHVVQEMSLASCARILHTAPLTTIVVDVLARLFPDDGLDAATNALVPGLVGQPNKEHSEIGNLDVQAKKSKKRKRLSEAQENPATSAHEFPFEQKLQVFFRIAQFLRTVEVKCAINNGSREAALRFSVQATLKLSKQKRMQFVKYWVHAISHSLVSVRPASITASNSIGSLSLMLDIWKLQPSPATSERNELTSLFCQYCGWSLFVLYSLLEAKEPTPNHPGTSASDYKSLNVLVERLIARNMLQPARAALLDSQNHKEQLSAVGLGKIVESFLGPIRSMMTSLRSDGENDLFKSRSLSLVQRGLPKLFRLAVRISRLDAPKYRAAETSWLDALFSLLYPLAESTKKSSRQQTLDGGSNVLCSMLDCLLEKKVSLSRETLETIVDRSCHLTLQASPTNREKSDHPDPDMKLVAHIVAMDPNTFVGDGQSNRLICQNLFDALTQSARIEGFFLRPVNEDDDEDSLRLIESWRDGIVVPLMKGFVRNRNLPSFFQSWQKSLAKEASQTETEALGADYNVWRDKDLQDPLARVLESSMTTQQIKELVLSLLSDLNSALVHVNAKSNGDTDTRDNTRAICSACIYLLDITIGAITSDDAIEVLSETVSSVLDTCTSKTDAIQTLLGGQGITCVLSLVFKIHKQWLPLQSVGQAATTLTEATKPAIDEQISVRAKETKLQSVAIGLARSHALTKGTIDKRSSETAHQACLYLVQVCDIHRRMPEMDEYVNQIVASLVLCDARSAADDKLNDIDANRCHPKSIFARKPRIAASVLIEFPKTWNLLQPQARDSLLSVLVSSLGSAKSAAISLKDQRLFRSMILAIAKDATRGSSSQLFEGLYQQLASTEIWKQQLLVCIMTKDWSSMMLSHGQREKLINWATEAVGLQEGAMAPESLLGYLSLIELLSRVPFGKPQLLSNADILWRLASRIDEVATEDLESVRVIIIKICQNIFEQTEKATGNAKAGEFWLNCSQLAVKWLETLNTDDRTVGKAAFASAFFQHVEAHHSSLDCQELPHKEPSFVTTLASRLFPSTSIDKRKKTGTAAVEIPSIALDLPFSYWQHGGLEVGQAVLDAGMRLLKDSDGVAPAHQDLRSTHQDASLTSWWLRLQQCSEKEMTDLIGALTRLLGEDLGAQDLVAVEDAYAESMARFSLEGQLAVINELMIEGAENGAQRVVLIELALISLDKPRDFSPEIGDSLMALCPRLISRLETEANEEIHEHLVSSIDTILRKKPFLVNQFSVEMLLGVLGKLVSPRSPLSTTKKGSAIDMQLGKMLQALLQFHRQSLGGRLHLIVPVLEQMLACLFIPLRGSADSKLFRHPPWLDTSAEPLGVRHAQRFARLLTLLCNPPQSTVSGHRSRASGPQLVDSVRKVRIHAGQHAQSILHAYCRMLLHGRMGEGVKEALTSGLWAIIDVMDMGASDELRIKVLGASMTKQELALLRREYESWKRFGAWKGG